MNSTSLRTHFETGLQLVFERWGEARFVEAYLRVENDRDRGSLDPQLLREVIHFRQWHMELTEARDHLPTVPAGDRYFDQALQDALDRSAAVKGPSGPSDVTVATWTGRGSHFMRVCQAGRPAQGYRFEGEEDGDAITWIC